MIRLDDQLVLSPRLTPTEARLLIFAWWKTDEPVRSGEPWIEGKITGPFCEYAATLSTRTSFESHSPRIRRLVAEVAKLSAASGEQQLSPSDPKSHPTRLTAAVNILEPCFWAPDHPFCYEVSLELHDDERLLDMRRIVSGIRHLAVARRELLLNGQEVFLNGVRHRPEATIEELEAWHEVECSAFLVGARDDLCARTDRWGPMVLHILPRTKDEARDQVIKLRNHPSVLIWVVPSRIHGRDLEEFLGTIKAHDPSRPIGQLVAVDEPIQSSSPVDMFFLPAGHWAIGSANFAKPYAVLGDTAADPDVSQFENFTNQTEELRDSLGSPPGLVGVIL